MKWVGWMAVWLASIIFSSTAPASAHGPTVEVTPAGFKPRLLNLFEGTTVHFKSSVATAGGLVISDEARTFASPPIAAEGDGWHYTFEAIGTHEIRIEQRPEAKMRIVVVKRPTP